MMLVTTITSEETFTFAPNNGEDEIHIRSGRLREFLLARCMDKVIDLAFPRQTLNEIIQLSGLEKSRMKSMTLKEAREPVIVGLHPGGTHLLIDGGHRRWFWAKRGKHTIKGWAVPYEVWMDYVFDPATSAGIHHQDGALLPQRRNR